MPEPTLVPLPGSERYEQPGATRIGPVPADETIQFSVVVRPRMGAPDMGEVARNAAITGQFLGREELADAEAPDPADVQAVEEYARRNGLTVEGVDPVTRRVKLAGSAAAVKQAFGVSLDRYEHQGTTFRGRTGPVQVPESLAAVIVGVLGTDDRPMAHRLTTVTPQSVSGHSVPMTAVQMASYYNYPAGLDGTGQCIGIIEFGGGYFIQDITGTSRSGGPVHLQLIPAAAGRPRRRASGLPRSVLLLQVRAQRGHGPRGVAFHRAAADAHRGRDLSLREIRVVPQHDRLALPAGQLAQRGDHRGPFQLHQRAVLGAGHVR
jgi:pro-kumamolisin-like protein